MLQALIKRDCPKITALTPVKIIKKQLLQYKALIVVNEEDDNGYLGMLTPEDILENPYQLVADCLTTKPVLCGEDTKISALQAMVKHRVAALPVFYHDRLEGLLFKDDLVKCLELEVVGLERILKGGEVFLKNVSSRQSHYLRSPIANLIGLGEVLKLAETLEEQQDAIKMMIRCAAQADAALTEIQQIVDQQLSLYTAE